MVLYSVETECNVCCCHVTLASQPAAEEAGPSAYGEDGFGGLAPGPSRSTEFGQPAIGRSEGAHQRQATSEHLQQAQLQALQQQEHHQQQLEQRQQQLQRQQQQQDAANAAQGQAHMQQMADAAAAQATQHSLMQQLGGHVTPPPVSQGLQHGRAMQGGLHSGGQQPHLAGADVQQAAAQPPPGSEGGGKQGRKQAAAAAPTTSDMNWESADAPGGSVPPHCWLMFSASGSSLPFQIPNFLHTVAPGLS